MSAGTLLSTGFGANEHEAAHRILQKLQDNIFGDGIIDLGPIL